MSMIRVDYDNARRQAKRLEEAADSCEEIVRKLKAGMQQLPQYWEGASADAFSLVVQQQLSEIQAMQRKLETVAAHIRRVAAELERKERELAAMAQGAADAAGGLSGGGGGAFGGGGGGSRSGGGF